jgi:hypothetical protein
LTGYTPPTALSRAGYTATWTAGTDAEILILVGAIGRQRNDGVTVICRVPDTGTFTVPASTFELIPASDDHAIVIVGRIAETVATMADARVTFDVLSAVGSGVLVLAQTPARATTEVVAPCPCETSPRLYISFSTGFGGASRVGVTPPVGGFSWRLQVAERLAHGLHLVEEYNEIGSDYLSPAPIGTSEDHGSIGVGVRWTPFEPQPRPSHFPFAPYMDVHAFYLTAVVGADVRDRLAQTSPTQTTDQTAWSPMASLALGVLELQGHDWSIGPEFREQLARFDGHFQRGWQLLFAIHLNQW